MDTTSFVNSFGHEHSKTQQISIQHDFIQGFLVANNPNAPLLVKQQGINTNCILDIVIKQQEINTNCILDIVIDTFNDENLTLANIFCIHLENKIDNNTYLTN